MTSTATDYITKCITEDNVNPFKVFVGNLDGRTTKDELFSIFSEFGKIVDIFIHEYVEWAIVEYKNADDACYALGVTTDYIFGNNYVDVSIAKLNHHDYAIFVSNGLITPKKKTKKKRMAIKTPLRSFVPHPPVGPAKKEKKKMAPIAPPSLPLPSFASLQHFQV